VTRSHAERPRGRGRYCGFTREPAGFLAVRDGTGARAGWLPAAVLHPAVHPAGYPAVHPAVYPIGYTEPPVFFARAWQTAARYGMILLSKRNGLGTAGKRLGMEAR
jgi:hypothetical protein